MLCLKWFSEIFYFHGITLLITQDSDSAKWITEIDTLGIKAYILKYTFSIKHKFILMVFVLLHVVNNIEHTKNIYQPELNFHSFHTDILAIMLHQ